MSLPSYEFHPPQQSHGNSSCKKTVAVRLRALEAKIDSSPAVAGAVLSLSAPDEPTLTP